MGVWACGLIQWKLSMKDDEMMKDALAMMILTA